MTQSFRHWEDVQEGEILPTLRFPITVKTLVLAVCGTRDLMPYHHNSAYSKSLGNRDMFVNTMFEQALFAHGDDQAVDVIRLHVGAPIRTDVHNDARRFEEFLPTGFKNDLS